MGHKFERGQEEILSCVESAGPTHKNSLVLSVTTSTSPHPGKTMPSGFFQWTSKVSYLDELLGISTISMDFDPSSLEGEAHLQAYMQVQQVSNDTDPIIWWKQHHQEFPDLARMTRQYLTVPATSVSPEKFFSLVGLVQTDLQGRLLDTTMIDLMWTKQAP